MAETEPADRPQRRAAQYIRMSSEHQRYSIERQSVAIAAYAKLRGFEIVRSYIDPGKSGLSLKGRKALQQLLADALGSARDFDTILVLDVSRWGRFQDADESAHYEFICKQAGVRIEYCAEPFENDGSITSSIVKVIKRMMAGEYSRDLSAKVSAAHLRHAGRGRIQGQHTPYAIRRQLMGPDGRPIQIMKPGDRKILSGSWVAWVPGPENEIRAVRAIFEMYVRRKLPMARIVRHLNETPEFRGDGWDWTAYRVRTVLRHEAYIGNYVYNRTRSQLQSSPIRNDEAAWIRLPILPPIVSKDLFAKAQKRLPMRVGKAKLYTDADLLVILRRILRKHGKITAELIDATSGAPSTETYWKRFGSLAGAYRKVGAPISKSFRDNSGLIWSEEARLQCLRDLYAKHGYVSQKLIDATPGIPTSSTYYNYYKSIKTACIRAGVPIVADPGCYPMARPRTPGGELRPMFREVCVDGRVVWTTFSNEAIITALRQMLARDGRLSSKTIRKAPGLPSISTITKRFGCMRKAYELAGWPHSRGSIQPAHSDHADQVVARGEGPRSAPTRSAAARSLRSAPASRSRPPRPRRPTPA